MDVLDEVKRAADAARQARAQAERKQDAYVAALRAALADHSKVEVAQAAGVSFQAVYKAIGKRKHSLVQ